MDILKIGLLQMSFSGAVLIIAAAVLRALFLNRLPKRTFCILWGIVLVRLLMPFSIIISGPGVSSFFPGEGKAPSLLEIPVQGLPLGEKITGAVKEGPAAPELSFITMERAVEIWNAVWFLGMILLAGYFILAYCRARIRFAESSIEADPAVVNMGKQLSRKRPSRKKLSGKKLFGKKPFPERTVSIRRSSFVKSPLTYGLLHPVILLPEGMSLENREELLFVLAHETAHIRHFDGFSKLLMTAALCIHWFNPFVWGMYIFFNRDLELACDENVVMQFGQAARAAYASALISMEEGKRRFRPFCSCFSENAMEERIQSIMRAKKVTAKRRKVRILAAAGAVSLVLAVLAGTSVRAGEDGVLAGSQSSGRGLAYGGQSGGGLAGGGQTGDGLAGDKSAGGGLSGDGSLDAVIRGVLGTGDLMTGNPGAEGLTAEKLTVRGQTPETAGTEGSTVESSTAEWLAIDVMEYITDDDAGRKQELVELGVIGEADMPDGDGLLLDGYFIYNPEEELIRVPLAEEVSFDIIDWYGQFTGEDGISRYVTCDVEEFKKYLNNYDLNEYYRKLPPFILEYREGKVVSVKEIWVN